MSISDIGPTPYSHRPSDFFINAALTHAKKIDETLADIARLIEQGNRGSELVEQVDQLVNHTGVLEYFIKNNATAFTQIQRETLEKAIHSFQSLKDLLTQESVKESQNHVRLVYERLRS